MRQLQISLFVTDPFDPCIQAHAVAVGAAEIAAVLVGISIKDLMIYPLPVVAAEGAACLDFLSPQRPGVEDKPTPSGRVHNGDLIVDFCGQTVSPPSCGSLLRKGNGSYGFHLQRRAADTFCHDDLSGGPYIGKVIYRLHVIDKHGVIPPGQPLHQLRDLHAGPDLLR